MKARKSQRPRWEHWGKSGGVVDDATRARLIAEFLARGGKIKRIEGASYVPERDRCTPAEARSMEQAR